MADLDASRFFPYDDVYANQRAAMDRIASALAAGDDVLFEGACGTGKTLAALAPALAFARRADKTVVITTNVHQQMRQFVSEARAITRTEPIRAVVFRGKSSMCHIDVGYRECQTLRDTTYERVELERDRAELERRQREQLEASRAGDEDASAARAAVMEELTAVEEALADHADRNGCDRFYTNLTTDAAEFEAWLFEDVRTPDEVYVRAHERGFCGYERLKEAMDGVDLVVCNYHHLLDPGIRQQFFRWLGREADDIVAVFDEAHNIERAAREHASRTLTERTLAGAIEELADLEDARAESAAGLIDAFRAGLVAAYGRALDGESPPGADDGWVDLPIDHADRPDDVTRFFADRYDGDLESALESALVLGTDLEERYELAYKRGETDVRRESRVRRSAEFIETYLAEAGALGQYPVVSVRRREPAGAVAGRVELFTCLPRAVTRPLFGALHASVLMSATLRPFDVTADVLGLEDPERMAFELAFPPANRRTFAVDTPPLFASRREDPTLQRTVTTVLEDAIAFSPGNVLVYFPSYAEAARYADRVDVDGQVFLDEAGTRAEGLRAEFAAGHDGALFTSLWGTLTEGVSFDGDEARTVVVVGVPYPYLDDRLDAIQSAYADAFAGRTDDPGWEYAVEIPTVRKTRQALGRVLRAPDEVGARVLVDRRYTAADMGEYGVRETFPSEERAELIDVQPTKLKYALLNFFAEHDAWNGARPTP